MNLLAWFQHFFIPRQSNNHKARILHPSSLSVLVALFLITQFGLNFFLLVEPSVLGFASNITPERVIELTNQKRLESGLSPLNLNSTLNQVAQAKAGDMFAFNYWAHNSPSGRDPWSFFREAGYNYLYAGENLARDFMTSDAAVEAWMNSPTHRENILNGKYKEIGLAVVDGTLEGVETTLVVQVFGTPTPAPVAQKPTTPLTTPETVPIPVPKLGEASAIEEEIPLTPIALAQATGEEKHTLPLLSPFFLTKTLAVFLMGILFGALLLDWVLVYYKKLPRLSGRNLAHLSLIGTLLLAALLTQQGAIL